MGLLRKFRKEKKISYKDEVLEHLSDFLNTRKNSGTYPLDYGVDSYVYLGTDKKVEQQIISDIKTGLDRFEKRVHGVEIKSLPSENCFLLSFMIQCKIEDTAFVFQLSFHHQKNAFNVEAQS